MRPLHMRKARRASPAGQKNTKPKTVRPIQASFPKSSSFAIAAKLDDFGKLAWIGLTVLGFVFFWPAGLALLAFLIWSGRMACWKRGYRNGWQGLGAPAG